MKLELHTAEKHEAVRGWDILSSGLGFTSALLFGACLLNPKEPINAIRIPLIPIFAMASVAAEKLRESDLMSLDQATSFQSSIKTEKIKKHTLLTQTIDDLKIEEELFQSVPMDRWHDLAERTGIKPPNLEARAALQNNTALGQDIIPEPEVQGATVATIEPDPCSEGYDPEEETQPVEANQDSLIFANQVESWFLEKGDHVPSSLIQEWRENPGIAIKIENGQANIVRNT